MGVIGGMLGLDMTCSSPSSFPLSLFSCCQEMHNFSVVCYSAQILWLAADPGMMGTGDIGLPFLKP